jgi:hypothetical protein
VEDGKELGGGVVARVVAEGPLDREVALLDVALEDDLGGRRHLEIDRHALDDLHGVAAEEAGEHQLVDVFRKRRTCAVGADRVEPEPDRHLHPALGAGVISATVLVELPVHRGRARAEHLHAIHAHVPLAGLGIARDHCRQGDERRGVEGPARLDREHAEVDLLAAQHDLLTGPLPHRAREGVGNRLELPEAAQLVDQACGRLHLEHVGELRADLVEPLHPEGEAHAALGSELVDEECVPAAGGALEQKRRPARLHHSRDDLRHLEVRIHLRGNADELALPLEQGDPRPQVGRRGQQRQYELGRRALRRWDTDFVSSPSAITARNTRPTISMATMMCRPSVAAS